MMSLLFTAILLLNSGCEEKQPEYRLNDLKISIEEGNEWLHDFPIFLGIKKKNAPQIAVWVEDLEGNYLSTIYVSEKIATQSWIAAGGNRRKESLPHWCYCRGVKYEDGLYLPTKKEPLLDGISGATPKQGFELKLTPRSSITEFIVKVEVNHSVDFNEYYPKDAIEGDKNYSGGKMGSGQPAVVYAAKVNLDNPQKTFSAILLGHSSADGTDGKIYTDVSTLSSALEIIKRITITIR